MFRLTMQFGGKPIKKYTFDKPRVSIGRGEICDIVIDNIGASREHATIESTEEGYVLADLGSQNGTFVGGDKIFHHQLAEGDEFFIGKYAFIFELLEPVVEIDEPVSEAAAATASADMTFHLDKKELDRIMSQSKQGAASQLIQIEPIGAKSTVVLEKPYYLIGKAGHAPIKLSGFFAPATAAVIVRTEHGYRCLTLHKKFEVNGKHVSDTPLSDGDTIACSGLKWRFSQA